MMGNLVRNRKTISAMHLSDTRPAIPRESAGAPPAETALSAPRGAVLLGGSHGTIALARLLARQGLDVRFFTDDTPLPRFSRAISAAHRWPGADEPARALAFLEERAARDGLEGYLLIPSTDADVRLVSLEHERLSQTFTVMVPPWGRLRWAGDKALTYARAAELGLAIPATHAIAGRAEAVTAEFDYPVALKPAMRLAPNRFTRDKVWRAENREAFIRLYNAAADLVGEEGVVVQELIPGGGECQLSYGALWWHGRPVAGFTARRLRQYPIEFSYTSTYVETIEDAEVRVASETFLSSCGHHGLVEIEYKRDPRTGALKMLDVNPRPWTWFGLADAAGLDFGALIAALARGEEVPGMSARPDVGWLFAQRDVVVAAQLALAGGFDFGAWARSWSRARTVATFSFTDPLPAIVEMPLTLVRVLGRRLFAGPSS